MANLHVDIQDGINLTVAEYDSRNLSLGLQVVEVNAPIYDGVYEVTPNNSVQTLNTKGKKLLSNIVIKQIPSDYDADLRRESI